MPSSRITENAPDSIFVLDEQGYYLDVNPAAALFDWLFQRGTIDREVWRKYITTESLEEYFVEFRNLLENGIASRGNS